MADSSDNSSYTGKSSGASRRTTNEHDSRLARTPFRQTAGARTDFAEIRRNILKNKRKGEKERVPRNEPSTRSARALNISDGSSIVKEYRGSRDRRSTSRSSSSSRASNHSSSRRGCTIPSRNTGSFSTYSQATEKRLRRQPPTGEEQVIVRMKLSSLRRILESTIDEPDRTVVELKVPLSSLALESGARSISSVATFSDSG